MRAVAAYRKSGDGELDLHVGDEVEVEERGGEMWRGTVRGRTGRFPGRFMDFHLPQFYIFYHFLSK